MESQDKLPRKRATDIEVQTRTRDVVKMMMNLASNQEVRDFLHNTYDVEIHSANRYIKLANEEIRKYHKPLIATVINSHVKKYTEIAKRNEMDDPRTSILALNSIEKILKITGSGINSDKLTVNQQINVFEGIDTEELNSLLKRINESGGDTNIIEVQEEPF